MEISKLLRPHLHQLIPYSSARDEFTGKADVYLDANENSIGSTSKKKYRRYPDPYQKLLKKKIASIKKVAASRIFLGNGSDEAIDLLIRAFCNPGNDKIIVTPPTYGMYEVCASINDVDVIEVVLDIDFNLQADRVLDAIEPGTKIIFLCSPNNPTGNSLAPEVVQEILERFQGLVVVDEAYIDFSPHGSWSTQIGKYKNLIVLQTFSKAWGLASLRLGMAFANEEIVTILNRIKPPYNISGATQDLVLKAFEDRTNKKEMVKEILSQKKILIEHLETIEQIQKIYPSDANFILIKIEDAHDIYLQLIEKKVIVRDRSSVQLCRDCLRITVGSSLENEKLLNALKQICS